MPDNPSSSEITPDFIFGTLATDALRLNSMKQERSGLWHDQRLRPSDPRPGNPIIIMIGVGPDIAADRITLYYTTDGTIPTGYNGQAETGAAVQMSPKVVEWDTLLWGYRVAWHGIIPAQPAGTHVQYIIEAWQSAGSHHNYAGTGNLPQVYGFYVDTHTVPSWLKKAVIYQIFVDRFAPSPGQPFAIPADPLNGFYGGSLKGITSRLDYLADLGITCLWLTPIYPSPSHHGYDITDYNTIEPRLGTLADFDGLIAEAHRRGIYVLLDFVANHLSSQHPAFLAAQQKRQSPTGDWFTFTNWPNQYETFFNVPQMPTLNTDNPGARRYLINSACYWLQRGADGFRLDHAYGPTHAFWSAFRAGTRRVNPHSVMLGEVVETPLLQRSYAGRMDGCLDFLLHQALRNFFSFGQSNVSQFHAFLQRHYNFFPADYSLPSFLDNHDMNRFLWTIGGNKQRLKLAALCQFTMPGPPIIYYGTEVGLNQHKNVGRLEESRLPMLWDAEQDRDLLTFYQSLITLRKTDSAVWQMPRRALVIDDTNNLYVYTNTAYTIALNNNPRPITISLPEYRHAQIALVTDPSVTWHTSTGKLTLPSFAGACLRNP